MSYYPPVEDIVWKATIDPAYRNLYDGYKLGLSGFVWVMHNESAPWICDFKISKTLEGVQAFIDNNMTYQGAVHRVVMDTSTNNGVYFIDKNQNDQLYARKLASEKVQNIDSSMDMGEAQNGFFSLIGLPYEGVHDDYWPMDGPFIYLIYDRGRLLCQHAMKVENPIPYEGYRHIDTFEHAKMMCSPYHAFDRDASGGITRDRGYWYLTYPGSFISVIKDPDPSKNGLYFIAGNTYPEMHLRRIAFEDELQ